MHGSTLMFSVAQAAASGSPEASGSAQSPLMSFGMMAIMVAIFYMLILRPQRRREKERQELLRSVKSGDRVLFSGGIIGIVTNVKERTLVLRVSDKVKMEVVRSAVNQVLKPDELPADVDTETSK